ncbi:MAG TPA: hypothetical protein VIL86_13815 [Tepidisphaeraceae bacterium]|jgi:hypothetical protein
MTWLIRLLGVHLDGAGRVAGGTLHLRGGISAAWVLLAAVALGALVVWMYRRVGEHVSGLKKGLLAGLRIALLLLILALILRPVLTLAIEGTIRRSLLMLFDTTASMTIDDPRTQEIDLKRAAIAKDLLDAGKGLDQTLAGRDAKTLARVPRVDLLKAALKNPRIDLLARLAKEYDLRPFAFGQQLQDLAPPQPDQSRDKPDEKRDNSAAWVDGLKANAPSTAGGDALRELISRTRGQPLAGIFMAWDGANNSGSSALAAAEIAKRDGIPLYIYGVGISSSKDIIVDNLFAPEVAFAEDDLPVSVRVRGQGFAGESAIVKLQLGDQHIEEKITLSNAEQVVPLKVKTAKIAPEKQRDFELKVWVDAREDEAVATNNSRSQHLRVIDDRIKVLYVEQSPRWEFRYLQALLLRDRRVDVKCVLLEGDPNIAAVENSPYLERIPPKKEDLFKYDLIILGDVDPAAFTTGQMEIFSEFVSQFGGGMIFLSGRRDNPWAYHNTPLEKMLPVEFEDERGKAQGGPAIGMVGMDDMADKPIKLELTAEGKRATMLRLADKEQESTQIWAKLPPIYWTAPVSRAKPAAEVLLVDPDPARASRFGKMPVVALQQYGAGQVLFVGTDNTWRWRKNNGDQYYLALWGQMVQRLSLPHLLGLAKRTQIMPARDNYAMYDRVTVYARLYSESFEPVTDEELRGYYKVEGQEGQAVKLRRMPNQPGMYFAEFLATAPGKYEFWVERDPEHRAQFMVGESQIEKAEPAMNEAMLREMARISGGLFLREEDLYKLPDQIGAKTERVRSMVDVEVWSSPLYFLLMLAVVTAEWILRKMSHLK